MIQLKKLHGKKRNKTYCFDRWKEKATRQNNECLNAIFSYILVDLVVISFWNLFFFQFALSLSFSLWISFYFVLFMCWSCVFFFNCFFHLKQTLFLWKGNCCRFWMLKKKKKRLSKWKMIVCCCCLKSCVMIDFQSFYTAIMMQNYLLIHG